jgi:hypothetical protein
MGGRRTVWIGLAVVALAAALLWLAGGRTPAPTEPAPAMRAAAPPASREDAGAPAPAAPSLESTPATRRPPELPQEGTLADDEPDELGGDVIAAAWARVDLAAVQRALPDNLFWTNGAPTTDEAELERRARERDQWNVAYGKVLSGTGSEEEIRAYYDHRARLSGDYVEFTTYLLDHYGDDLTERDVSLLTLARRLHLARLEEVPRRMEEALARKQQQDDARARWLADEKAFREDAPLDPDASRR